MTTTPPSVWLLLEQLANGAVMCCREAEGDKGGRPPPPISFRFSEIPSNKAGNCLCEVAVTFSDIGLEAAFPMKCELDRLLCRTLKETLALNVKTKVFVQSKGASCSTAFEVALDPQGNCHILSQKEQKHSVNPFGETTLLMVLPCDIREFDKEGQSFVQYCGVLQKEFGFKFIVAVRTSQGGERVLDVPDQLLSGSCQVNGPHYFVRCVAQLNETDEPSEPVFLNCVSRSKFYLLKQEIQNFCVESGWEEATKRHAEVQKVFSPSVARKSVLLLFWVGAVDPCPILSNPLMTPDDLKVELSPSFPLTMEQCAHNAMAVLLDEILCDKPNFSQGPGKLEPQEFEKLYIPSMASAISAIFNRTQNDSLQKEALSLLELETVEEIQPTIQRLLMEMYLGLSPQA